ncbi:MAG: MarR family transcriptional regulator [Eubacteriales bacterium]|nr:MarR family transcriptional regulator [Eubacteriales bacterium]
MDQALAKLNRLFKKQNEIYRECAKNAGITESKFWLLYALCASNDSKSESEFTQYNFCEDWCFSKQTINTAVSDLEKEGLIKLEFTPGSRKHKSIKLTASGEEFCQAKIRSVLRAEKKSLMKLGSEERAEFLDLLERLLLCLESELL